MTFMLLYPLQQKSIDIRCFTMVTLSSFRTIKIRRSREAKKEYKHKGGNAEAGDYVIEHKTLVLRGKGFQNSKSAMYNSVT